jgi:Lsr2
MYQMAQITEVRLLDDLDGGEAAQSVAFSLDGKSYEIDLSEKHAAVLRDAFAPYVSSARRVGGSAVASRRVSTRMSTATGRSREDTAAIREWATTNGLQVSARGRISSTVLEAYENRGNSAVAPAAEPVVEPAVEPVAEVKPKRRTRKKAAAEA